MRKHLVLARPLALLTLLACSEPFLRQPRPSSCDPVIDGTVLPLEALRADDQTALAHLASTQRLLVVRASCTGVTLLARCTLSGRYHYQSPRTEIELMADASDDFAAPDATTKTRLADPFPVGARLVRTAEAVTLHERPQRAQLSGDCAGATHVVRAISVRTTPASEPSDLCRSSAELPPASCGYAVTLELAALARPDPPPLQTSARSE